MPRNPFVSYRIPTLPPELQNLPNFLKYLDLSPKELRLISAKRPEQYNILTRPKRGGGERILTVPNARLRFLQRLVYEVLVPLYNPKWCVQGFVRERSALSNAQKHLGRSHLVKIDFKDYFNQVSPRRIRGVLHYFGVPKDVQEAITVLCTIYGQLPQGSPASPLLANMVTFRLDQVMLEYSRANRLRYTRYADDITLSSYSRPRILKSSVDTNYARLRRDDFDEGFLSILEGEDFPLNEEKLYYCGIGARRTVTGYTINEFPNVPRPHIRRVRAILHDIKKNGYPAAQLRFSKNERSIKSLKNSLRGRILWISATKGVSDPVYRRYAIAFNDEFKESLPIGPDLTKLSGLSTWVIEAFRLSDKMIAAQGTAFFLDGAGLVTAAHCLPSNCYYEVFSIERPSKRYAVSVQKSHAHIDLAILDHKVPDTEYIYLSTSRREINVGEDVVSWGYPDYGPGKQLTTKSGKVSSKPTLSGVGMYAVDIKLYQGTSGGPILNSSKEVVGVTHKGGDGQAHDLAVKISHLKDI